MKKNNKSIDKQHPQYKKGGNNGRRPQNADKHFRDKDRTPDKEMDFRLDNGKGCNDPAWYAHNPVALRDTASIAWNGVLGSKVPALTKKFNNDTSVTFHPRRFPGVGVLHFIPTYGQRFDPDDNGVTAGNIAAQNIYTWVRHENSGSRNYEAPDLFMYLCALDSLYMLIAEGRRLYGLSRRYNTMNRYWGENMIRALGYADAADIIDDPVAVRSFVNTAAIRIASLNAPAEMNIFKRHFWLNDNVWLDSEEDTAIAYAYRASHYYKWKATAQETGTSLEPIAAPTTWAEYKALMNDLINALLNDEDAGVISGDIRKAYSNTFTLELMHEDYVVTPTYNREVLYQIANTCMLGGVNTGDSVTVAWIQQSNGVILSKHLLTSQECTFHGFNQMLPVTTEPGLDTPEMNMVILRNRFTVAPDPDRPNQMCKLRNAGSEVFTHMSIAYIGDFDAGATFDKFDVQTFMTMGPTQFGNLMARIDLLNHMEKHPLVINYSNGGATGNATATQMYSNSVVLFDADKFTYVSPEVVERMNDVAILSLWNVPI